MQADRFGRELGKQSEEGSRDPPGVSEKLSALKARLEANKKSAEGNAPSPARCATLLLNRQGRVLQKLFSRLIVLSYYCFLLSFLRFCGASVAMTWHLQHGNRMLADEWHGNAMQARGVQGSTHRCGAPPKRVIPVDQIALQPTAFQGMPWAAPGSCNGISSTCTASNCMICRACKPEHFMPVRNSACQTFPISCLQIPTIRSNSKQAR